MPSPRRASTPPDHRTIRLILPASALPVPVKVPESAFRLTRHVRRVHARRLAKVQVMLNRLGEGLSLRQAAKAARLTYPTGRRYLIAWNRDGARGLLPRFQLSGRTSELERLGITPAELATAQHTVLAAGSTTAGLRQYASSSACPAALAGRLAARSVPPSIRRAVQVATVPARVRIGVDFMAVEFQLEVRRG